MNQVEDQKKIEEVDLKRWFVCTTKFQQEKIAVENIDRIAVKEGIHMEPYLPMRLAEVRPRGQPLRIQPLPFFPRYLFVHVDLAVKSWRALFSARGVIGVLPSTEHGSAALARLVADIQAREVDGFVQLTPAELPCPFAPGDRVTFGAFVDAIFQERVDDRRCMILISLLGRDSRQIVDLADLE